MNASPESFKIYWVTCNYHWIIPSYKILIYLKFPRVPVDLVAELCTTCDGWRDNVQSLLIYIFLFSSWVSVDSEEQTDVNRKAVASIRAACAYLPASRPAPPRLGATEKTNAWRETGRQVSLLNSDEFSPAEGWEGKQKQAPERYTLRWDG